MPDHFQAEMFVNLSCDLSDLGLTLYLWLSSCPLCYTLGSNLSISPCAPTYVEDLCDLYNSLK